MERCCSTGQSPQRAAAPTEEEEESITPQLWDEISEEMTEERSEIEENNNMLFHFRREFRYLRNQNRGRVINDDHDSKWFAFISRLFLKGQTAIQDINERLVRFD